MILPLDQGSDSLDENKIHKKYLKQNTIAAMVEVNKGTVKHNGWEVKLSLAEKENDEY